jgi:hypothetical protein
MTEAMSDDTGNEGIDEYVPAGADPYEVNKNLPHITDGSGKVFASQVIKWGAIEKHFIVRTTQATNLTLRLFNYPAWQVTVNDQPMESSRTAVTGQMVIPVPEGRSEVRVKFGRTLDRTLGDVVSIISLILLGAAWIKTRPQSATSESA